MICENKYKMGLVIMNILYICLTLLQCYFNLKIARKILWVYKYSKGHKSDKRFYI